MDEFEDDGCESLEEAARGDIPPRFATVVGSRVSGDTTIVWLLTNDEPPFEAYDVYCERRNGRWCRDGGSGGLGFGAPHDVCVPLIELQPPADGSLRPLRLVTAPTGVSGRV